MSSSPLDDDVDELVGHDDHPPLLAVQVRLHLLGRPRARDQLVLRAARPAPARGRAPCRSPAATSSTVVALEQRLVGDRPRRAPTAASWPSAPHSSSATCGAYGCSSETAVSAAKRAAGSSGAFDSSLTSSITAAIGVLKTKRRSMSSVTRAIVSCALRASGVSTPRRRRRAAPRPRARRARAGGRSAPSRSIPSGRPVDVLVGRALEEDVDADRVGAELVDQLVRRDAALRLRHLLAVELHPALVEEPLERLAEADHAEVVHRLDEEARVEQVPLRVVDAADVLVDRHPVVGDRAVERRLRRCAGRCSAGSTRTSRRTCPSCPPRAAPGRRTIGHVDVDELVVRGERRLALRPVVLDLGQEHRQLVLGHRDDRRASRSRRSGSGSPSSAGARSSSRAGGS